MKKTFDEMYKAIQMSRDNKKIMKQNRLKKPQWLKKYKNDELNRIYEKQDDFWSYGKIAFGCVVQANTRLFSMGNSDNCPANFIYTYDEYYYENADKFHELAHNIYSLKESGSYETDELSEEEKYISHLLLSEYKRDFRIAVPQNMTEGHEVFLTTVMVDRDHIPLHKLCNFFYPMLTLENDSPDAIILPAWYWRGNFIYDFNFRCDNKIRPYMPEESDFTVSDAITFGMGRSFRMEHPWAFIFFTFCKILSFAVPLLIFCIAVDKFSEFMSQGTEIIMLFLSSIFIGFGLLSYVGSFMEQYFGDKPTKAMFTVGGLTAAVGVVLCFLQYFNI